MPHREAVETDGPLEPCDARHQQQLDEHGVGPDQRGESAPPPSQVLPVPSPRRSRRDGSTSDRYNSGDKPNPRDHLRLTDRPFTYPAPDPGGRRGGRGRIRRDCGRHAPNAGRHGWVIRVPMSPTRLRVSCGQGKSQARLGSRGSLTAAARASAGEVGFQRSRIVSTVDVNSRRLAYPSRFRVVRGVTLLKQPCAWHAFTERVATPRAPRPSAIQSAISPVYLVERQEFQRIIVHPCR